MDEEELAALGQQARLALADGNAVKARRLYENGLMVRADSADFHFGLATACFLLKDLPTAAQHFKETTKLDPKRAGAFINLGAILNRLNRLDEAAAALRRGIQLDNHRAEGYYNLGLVCRRQGKSDLALDAYREATRLNPKMLDAHYNLANLLLELGRHHQAIKHYKLALDINANFEKATAGLREAEAGLQHVVREEPVAAPVAPILSLPRKITSEQLQRTLDPLEDGTYLATLHKATIDSEKHSRAFLQILERDLETAIKDLSSTMLYPEKAAELSHRIHKLEVAMQNLQNEQKDLQASMKRVRKIGQHPPAGSPLESQPA